MAVQNFTMDIQDSDEIEPAGQVLSYGSDAKVGETRKQVLGCLAFVVTVLPTEPTYVLGKGPRCGRDIAAIVPESDIVDPWTARSSAVYRCHCFCWAS